nr:unnamed protein product [Spirometra erinaceieuropaei]
MDIDKNGILSKAEVKSCLLASGFDKKFVKKFLSTFDADGDGNITEDEYLRVVCTVPRREKQLAFWKSVFDDVDKDKSGKISCSELMILLKDMNFDCKLSELQEWGGATVIIDKIGCVNKANGIFSDVAAYILLTADPKKKLAAAIEKVVTELTRPKIISPDDSKLITLSDPISRARMVSQKYIKWMPH